MTFIAPLDPQQAPKEIRAVLERSPDLNLLAVMGQAPGTFKPWVRFSTALVSKLELSPLLRELAILQVALLEPGGDYEWCQHVPLALAAGATEAQLQALRRGALTMARFSHTQALLLRFTREVVWQGHASADTRAALLDLLGPRQAVELLLVIGHYMMVARIAAAAGLEPEAPRPVVARDGQVAPMTASNTVEGYPETYADAPDETVNPDAEIPAADHHVGVRRRSSQEVRR